ncbi:MAG: hypothetical protein ACSLFA_22780, partial [Mycobacterium sp.]
DTNKLASKKQTTHKTREDGKSPKMSGKKQQTKTTKHTIEFSNNRLDCCEVSRFGATLPA